MKILVTGATGFIGGNLIKALSDAGHKVIGAARGDMRKSRIGLRYGWMPVDFNQACTVDDWVNLLQGKRINVVINAVGILRETSQQKFSRVHDQAPQALFTAAQYCGVSQIIQISALGAQTGNSQYFKSKRKADESLCINQLRWTVLRPSVIYGEEGASTRLFKCLAALPLVPLVDGGMQPVQPLHIDELAQVVLRLINGPPRVNEIIDIVGERPISFRQYLSFIRRGSGLSKPRFISIPASLVTLAAMLGDVLHIPALSHESVRLLRQGSTGNPQSTTQLLGRKPTSVENFFPEIKLN